jgi:hypothetical protein
MTVRVTQSLEGLRERLTEGIPLDGLTLFAKRPKAGRFRREFDLDVCLREGAEEEHLLFLKAFTGWMPDYRPWVELFGIRFSLPLGKQQIEFADSAIETELLSLVADFLEPASHIFVEYYGDDETRRALEAGVPPAATRLGHKLFQLDFTWFKDWYFPEGFLEGGQKLQAQRPLDEESRARQLLKIREGLERFLAAHRDVRTEILLLRSFFRAEACLEFIERRLE